MLFRKTEGKRIKSGLLLTVGALAAAGAISITRKSKAWVKDKLRRITGGAEED